MTLRPIYSRYLLSLLALLIATSPVFAQFGNNFQQQQYEQQQRAYQEQQQRDAMRRSYEQIQQQQRQQELYRNQQREYSESQNRAQGYQLQQRQQADYYRQQQERFQDGLRQQERLQQQNVQNQEQFRRQQEQQDAWRRQAEESLRNSQRFYQAPRSVNHGHSNFGQGPNSTTASQRFGNAVRQFEEQRFPSKPSIMDRFDERSVTRQTHVTVESRFGEAIVKRGQSS